MTRPVSRALNVVAVSAFVAACAPASRNRTMSTAPAADASYIQSLDDWHAERMARLRAADGWLTPVALHWLDAGATTVGAAPSCDLAYDGLPAPVIGTYRVDAGGAVRFEPAPGATVDGVPADGAIATDADGPPTVLRAGACRLRVIDRDGRLAVRIRDDASPLRTTLPDVERFPVDPAWRIEAAFVPASELVETTVPIALVIGVTTDEPIAGRARFEHDGAAVDMVLLDGGDDAYFVVFGDATNADSTYGGGRFLLVERGGDDPSTVVLDFNRAYNPPCSFTPFATCPLPAPDNRLPFAVEAGERVPRVHVSR